MDPNRLNGNPLTGKNVHFELLISTPPQEIWIF